MRRIIALLLCASFSLSSQATTIVTSIKPLQLIAAAISAGGATPIQLLPNGASPHDYQLRPSDMRALSQADLVVWVGPELESFLAKPLATLPASVQQLALLPPGPLTSSKHGQHEHSAHDHDNHHDHRGVDPHIWLDPDQGIQIARAISTALAKRDNANAARYQANLARFEQAMAATDQQLRQLLGPLSQRGYFVFHDGYGYFEAHYGLNHRGALTLNPQRHPGARKLAEIRAQLQQPGTYCLFSEPQFNPSLVAAIGDGLELRQGVLDPLGASASSYPELLLSLGQQFHRCLSP